MAVLTRRLAAAALVLWCALPAGAQPTPTPPASPAPPAAAAPAGAAAQAHRAGVSANPVAQNAFDRGLLMLYAFNVGEARLAFRTAEDADPHAVLPFVGEAMAETIDINRPTTPDGERRGAAAVARGRAAAAAGSSDDRALYDATAARFDAKRSEKARFAAFFAGMQTYAEAHPADGMAATLAAYAGWNATGALTAGPADELTPDARTISADLDRALSIDPGDVGAHHLRIHFWEEAHHPERALEDADALAGLTFGPGESHLEHMAGHIYDRLGDYARMVAVNRGACANDDAYFAHGNGPGQGYMRTYHEHDIDFVLYGLTTVGRAAEARAFAASGSAFDQEVVALRDRDERDVLRLLGDAVTPLRVLAEARLGDLEAARKDLAAVTSGSSGDVDVDVATAAVARAAHDAAGAIAAYRKASAAAGSDLGDPKNHWWAPIGEGLGAALLVAHEAPEAEQVFRTELVRYPNDPRLEFGLAQALAAQGKDDRAARSASVAHWQGERPLELGDLG